jgi:PKD domain/NHL repeat
MARLAHGCAAIVVALALLATAGAASANTITTVAGGGSLAPQTYGAGEILDPLDVSLPSPGGIAWSGDPNGMLYVTSSDTCGLYWFDPDPQSDDYGLLVEGGTLGDCNPNAAGYTTYQDAHGVKLNHPCCVTSDARFDRSAVSATTGPYVADSGSGHVDHYQWFFNTGKTIAGGTPADCSDATLPATTDPAAAHFCTITGLARQTKSPYDYAFGEMGRGGGGTGNLYLVAGGVMQSAGAFDAIAALAFDQSNNLLVSDGNSAIIRYPCCPFAGIVVPIAGMRATRGDVDAPAATDARFRDPKGIAVAFDGSLYVADSGNCRIRRVANTNGSGAVTTVAGTGCGGGALGDGGQAVDANLDHPTGVTFAPTGLVISDTGHNRLRLIDRTSIVNAPAITTDSTPSFDVRSLDSPSHLECKLNGTVVDCSNLETLADGNYTLSAQEMGDATNPPDPPDPTPAVHTFAVDTTAPTGIALTTPAVDATGVPVDPDFTWTSGSDAVTGIDHYELWIDDAKSRDVATSACAGGSCSAKAAAPLGERGHTWQVRTVDKAGNPSATEKRSFTVGGAPTAAFTIAPNPALAGRVVTFNAGGSSDESGIARYQWDLDGNGEFETDSGGSPTTTQVYQAPTSLTVRLLVTDGVGKQSTAEQQLRVNAATGAQNLVGVSINNGAQYTRDPNVTLTVKAPATASAFLVSNDGGFFAPATFPAAPTIKWKLDSSGPERLPKTVYLRFQLGPIVSDNFTDDIILDEIPPVVQSASLASAASTRAASAARANTYTVKVKAKDSNSGVAKVQVTANKRKPGKLLAYKTKVKLKSAAKPKFVRARDRAGNYSGWKKLR